jgi:hypothetical protein
MYSGAGAAALLTKDRVNRVTPKQTSDTKHGSKNKPTRGTCSSRRPRRGPEAGVDRDENRSGDGRIEAADGEDEHGSREEDRSERSHEAQLSEARKENAAGLDYAEGGGERGRRGY